MENIIRLVARIGIKGNKLIKGINLEGLRILGDPNEFTMLYYRQSADDRLYMDAVAS
jgi:cyclase